MIEQIAVEAEGDDLRTQSWKVNITSIVRGRERGRERGKQG